MNDDKSMKFMRILLPDVRAKALEACRSLGERHGLARAWSLRSPDGAIYRFKNLGFFIREHRELFAPDQLRPVTRRGKTSIECSLEHLSPRRKHPRAVAQGWAWHIDGKNPETLLAIV